MLKRVVALLRERLGRLLTGVLLVTVFDIDVATAHPSGYRAGDAWWTAWSADPLIGMNLAVLLVVYVWGLGRLWNRVGFGRVISIKRAVAFGLGLLALVLALLSPLDTLSDDLSWVHMTQHMVLMAIAAPLVVVGSPGLASVWAMPRFLRRRWVGLLGATASVRRVAWSPSVAWCVYAITLWVWHVPYFYEWALEDPVVHDVEHITFFVAAWLFWRVVLDGRVTRRLHPIMAVAYLFGTTFHSMVLGVLMTLSPQVWYSVYVGRTERWGLTAIEDQQLAGAIMWMPACSVYAILAAWIFAAWLGMEEERAIRRDHARMWADAPIIRT